MDTPRKTVRLLVAIGLFVAILGMSLTLHLVQYGQISRLKMRLARFEKNTVKALAGNLIALEKTLSHQLTLERIFMHSAEMRLTFEQIENYNAKMKPHGYTTAYGGYDGQTQKLFQTEPVQSRTPSGTGAWEEAFFIYKTSP